MRNMFTAMRSRSDLRRRSFDTHAHPERRAQHHWAVTSSIDHFRDFRDIYGEILTTAMVGRVEDALIQSARGEDGVVRRGDGAFVIIVSGNSLEQARACAERHRKAVENLQIPHQASRFGIVTLSMGIATVVSAGRAGAALALANADRGLRRAKQTGRNRVATVPGLAPRLVGNKAGH